MLAQRGDLAHRCGVREVDALHALYIRRFLHPRGRHQRLRTGPECAMFEAMPWSLALSVELVDLKLPMAFSAACSMIGCATARDRRTRTCVDRAACTRQSCS